MPAPKTADIRELNDRFRKGDTSIPGRLLITAGMEALIADDPNNRAELLAAVRGFDAFNEDNDPHGEHDFGSLDFLGSKLFWKIDYYAPDLEYGSEDPADPQKTVRVLTIMLAEEY
jgi:hypothetical protein